MSVLRTKVDIFMSFGFMELKRKKKCVMIGVPLLITTRIEKEPILGTSPWQK